MSNQPTAVVIGAGFIGPVHAEALARAGVRVKGMLGVSPEESRAACERLHLPHAYGSLDEVLADGDVHAVHVATPNRLHFEHAASALRAGKHVLVEKPLAMTSAQCAELVSLAADTGLVAGVSYNLRFYPLVRDAAARVRRGELGRLLHVAGSYVQDWLTKPTDFNWRVLAEEGGALRAIADIGTHWLDQVQYVTGRRVVEVMADLRTVHPTRHRPLGGAQTFTGSSQGDSSTEPIGIDTEDCGAVMLRLDDGSNGVLWVSQTTAGRKNALQWEIAGEGGSLAWHSERSNQLWAGLRDAPSQAITRDPGALDPSAAAYSDYPAGHNEGFPDTFKQLFRAFYADVVKGSPSTTPEYATFADGLHEVRVCEAILTSHRERRWVAVEEG